MGNLLSRPQYLEQLVSFRDKDLIKVVTGIRRCGKSTLFDLYEAYLIPKPSVIEYVLSKDYAEYSQKLKARV